MGTLNPAETLEYQPPELIDLNTVLSAAGACADGSQDFNSCAAGAAVVTEPPLPCVAGAAPGP